MARSPPCGPCPKIRPADRQQQLLPATQNPDPMFHVEHPESGLESGVALWVRTIEQVLSNQATVRRKTPGWRHAWQEVQRWQNQTNPRKGSAGDWTV